MPGRENSSNVDCCKIIFLLLLLFDFCVMVYWGMAAMSTETQVGKLLWLR